MQSQVGQQIAQFLDGEAFFEVVASGVDDALLRQELLRLLAACSSRVDVDSQRWHRYLCLPS